MRKVTYTTNVAPDIDVTVNNVGGNVSTTLVFRSVDSDGSKTVSVSPELLDKISRALDTLLQEDKADQEKLSMKLPEQQEKKRGRPFGR